MSQTELKGYGMLTIEIHDAELAQRLREIAERENRPVEAVLKTLVAQYPDEAPVEPPKQGMSEGVKRVRRKAYAKARRYWESVGDVAKVALTDEDLDEQFGAFDEEGIPRLKSELTTLEPPVGSLAYAAKMAEEADIYMDSSFDASRADEILNEEFPNYLMRWMKDEDAQ
jgi:hypothetical protein